MLRFFQKSSSEMTIRILFWTIGPLMAATLTYTTRYFINGDAIAYVEMGEALRHGHVWGLANLTYSPGYPVLLALSQILLSTDPLNELELLRAANFFCFLFAMASCELFVAFCRREAKALAKQDKALLPAPLLSLLWYSVFLLAALDLVKVRLLNPDMLVMAITLTCASVVLWIREKPSVHRYVVLGMCCGIGYLVKSFFIVFSGVFFFLAVLCAGSYWKGLSRAAVAMLLMLLVGSPLILALSYKLGRFTTGELGKRGYAYFISSTGEPFRPITVDKTTGTFLRRDSDLVTRPFDICYWEEGIVPKFDMHIHFKLFLKNLGELPGQIPFIFLVLAWYLSQVRCCSYAFRSSHPPSFSLSLLFVAVASLGFYCLIHVETRYIAAALFIAFSALAMSVRCPGLKNWKPLIPSILFLCAVWLQLIHSGIDQSLRSLRSTPGKPSYKESYLELHAVKDFILGNGLKKGDETAILGESPVYWARFAGVRIPADIEAAEQFLSVGREERRSVLDKLQGHGILAVVGKGASLGHLVQEGWQRVTGTNDYYVIFLGPDLPKRGK